MHSSQQLAFEQNKHRAQMREAIRSLQESMQRVDITVDQQVELQERINTLKSKLSDLQTKAQSNQPLAMNAEITLDRIVHLREIFGHYCTHIFRVGKHMTFQRLEYEKVHMTLDRFFVLLRDFELTTIKINERLREVVPKVKIMKIFKMVSSNSKDVTFEEFIECLERIAVIYYDESEFMKDNKQINKHSRKIADKVKKKPNKALDDLKLSKKLTEEADITKQLHEQDSDNTNEKVKQDTNDQLEQIEGRQHQPPQRVDEEAKLYHQERMNSFEAVDDIQTQNELDVIINDNKKSQAELPQLKTPFSIPRQQKIEAFYKLIGVDSIREYRKKLGELNLPMFKSAHTRKASSIQLGRHIADSQLEPPTSDQAARMQQIKQKIEEQNAIDIIKRKLPKKPPTSTEQNDYFKILEDRKAKRQRQRERMERAKKVKEQMEEEYMRKMMQLPPPPPSKRLLANPAYKEHNVTWDDIERLNFEQIAQKDKDFHPHMLYDLDPDDEEFMGDLKFDMGNIQKHRVIARHHSKKQVKEIPRQQVRSDLDQLAHQRLKKTEDLIRDTKKRVSQIERNEKKQIKDINQRTNRPKARSSRVQL